MADLQGLADRLTRVSEARKLNASLRSMLHNRLSVIDAQLYVLMQTKSNPAPLMNYGQPQTHGLSDSERQRLVQIFWGKAADAGDSPRRYASASETLVSAVTQRASLLNAGRNARQRCLAVSGGRDRVAIARARVCVWDARFILIDAARYFIVGRVFADAVSMQAVLPWINGRRMREFIGKIAKEGARPLAEYGVDVERMQRQITAALRTADSESS
jgi:hypothetical protein